MSFQLIISAFQISLGVQLSFLVFKLTKVIAWSWLLILTPLLFWVVISIVALITLGLIFALFPIENDEEYE
jgi:membrane protein YdbS with pleckstrin-like domain